MRPKNLNAALRQAHRIAMSELAATGLPHRQLLDRLAMEAMRAVGVDTGATRRLINQARCQQRRYGGTLRSSFLDLRPNRPPKGHLISTAD